MTNKLHAAKHYFLHWLQAKRGDLFLVPETPAAK